MFADTLYDEDEDEYQHNTVNIALKPLILHVIVSRYGEIQMLGLLLINYFCDYKTQCNADESVAEIIAYSRCNNIMLRRTCFNCQTETLEHTV